MNNQLKIKVLQDLINTLNEMPEQESEEMPDEVSADESGDVESPVAAKMGMMKVSNLDEECDKPEMDPSKAMMVKKLLKKVS